MPRDSDLLFGTLAVQVGMITEGEFLEACRAWLARRDTSFPTILTESGRISPTDAAAVERLIARRLRSSESMELDDEVRRTLDALDDPPFDPEETTSPERLDDAGEEEAGTRVRRERYTLRRLHAQGGLGRVWLATDESLGREVALKEMRPERSEHPEIGARFLQEARVTGQLEHPNIVPVYELSRGGPDSPPFYAMRFVKGRTLAEAIRSHHQERRAGRAGPMEFRALLNALVAVGNAVAFAHARGVLHRDLKPHNVVLGDYGEVVVLDWGLAKQLGQSDPATEDLAATTARSFDPARGSTVEGHALGTPAYMPPEQAEGRSGRVDRRSDVYGLGAILYELLTDEPPFSDRDAATLLNKVREHPPIRPRWIVPSTDPALEAVCLKSLSKRQDARYESVAEFSAELQRWLAGEPVLAYDEPIATRARRWVSRHRTSVSAAAAALGVAVGALFVATILLAMSRDREHDARVLAERHRREAVAQGQQARENFNMARKAVERYLAIIGESELLVRPGLQPLREQLLRAGWEYYSKFAREHADDPTLQDDLAAAYLRLGRITEEIGSKTEALDHYHQAFEILSRWTSDRPGDGDRREALADCHNRLGNLHSALGATEEALASLGEARRLALQLIAESPGDARHRNRLAGIENNLGNVQRAAGRPAEALASYQRARYAFGLLALAVPEGDEAVTGFRSSVAGTDQNIGILLREMGRLDEALDALERARELRRDLVERRDDDRVRRELAQGLHQLGLVERDLGRGDDALASHQEARAIQEALVAANPAVTDYQRDLADSLVILGELASASGRPTESLQSLDRARTLYQGLAESNPNVNAFRARLASTTLSLGIVLQEAGRLDDARAAYRGAGDVLVPLLRVDPQDDALLRELAVVWNNLGTLERAAGRSAAALTLHRDARGLIERSLSHRPGSVESRTLLAQTHNHIGLALQDLDRRADALRVHEKALALLEHLRNASPDPDAAPLRRDVAVTLLNLAVVQQGAGRVDDALRNARRARSLFATLHDDAPDAVQGRRDLVSCLDFLGDLAREVGRDDEAAEVLTFARDLQREAVERLAARASPDDRAMLAGVFSRLAQLFEHREKLEEAADHAALAVQHQEAAFGASPGSPRDRALLSSLLGKLVRLLRRIERHDEADAAARRRLALARAIPVDPTELVQSAADLAGGLPDPADGTSPGALESPRSSPEVERRLADAWSALREAVEAGYAELDQLRERGDLARLFAAREVAAWFDEITSRRRNVPKPPAQNRDASTPPWKDARASA